jgi:hypothetical protein
MPHPRCVRHCNKYLGACQRVDVSQKTHRGLGDYGGLRPVTEPVNEPKSQGGAQMSMGKVEKQVDEARNRWEEVVKRAPQVE